MAAQASKMKGLVALVTGGSSGLGRATVERFVRQGANVALVDLPKSKGEEVAKEAAAGSKSCIFTPADVTSEKDIQQVLSKIKDTYGKLDCVVNCAGIAVAFKTYNFNKNRAHTYEDFMRVVTVS